MGKKDRIKRERAAKLAAEQAAHGPSAVSYGESADSRRKFIRNSALTVLKLGLGGTLYEYTKKYSADEASSPEYMSINEGVQIYRNLKKTVETKWKEAQQQKKPFRICVLEDHNSINACIYELMLVDIASKLGIRTLLPELGSNTLQQLLNLDPSQPRQLVYIGYVMQAALKKNYIIENIDTLYPTQADFNQAYFGLTKRFAEEELRKRYNTDVTVTIQPSEDINSLLFDFNISGHFSSPLTASQHQENGTILVHARQKAYAFIHDERNKTMLDTIKRHGDAIVVTGKEHGIGLIPALREADDIDVTFSVTDKSLASQELNSPIRDAEMQRRLDWADNPSNAIQYSEKDFNPENLQVFVNRIIEKANSRGRFFKL